MQCHIILFRLLFTMVLLPILQSFNFSLGIGVKFKNMPIAVKNDEISFSDCQDINVNECIFDKNSNQKMSCFVMNYLAIHNYILVSMFSILIKTMNGRYIEIRRDLFYQIYRINKDLE